MLSIRLKSMIRNPLRKNGDYYNTLGDKRFVPSHFYLFGLGYYYSISTSLESVRV